MPADRLCSAPAGRHRRSNSRRRSAPLVAALTLLGSLLLAPPAAAADAVTVANDNLRTAWDPDEPGLAPDQVGAADFGRQFSLQVDGQIYAQPLVIGNTAVVATENNNAYGVDVRTGAVLWTRAFGAPFTASTVRCGDLTPNIGITSTPVYDAATNTIYLTTKVADGPTEQEPSWYLQGLDAGTGRSKPGFPVRIQGTADNDPTVTFDPMLENQRPGLLLAAGKVYIGFGAHCDFGEWRGWVMAVSVTGTPAIASSWVTEVANGGGGGIWQSGGGLVSDGEDADGNPRIFLSTGNGISPAPGPGTQPPGQLAESVVRLGVGSGGHLEAKDFFAPADANVLDQNDTDLGSGAPTALPDSFGTPAHPHLLVQVGKDGRVFLLDRDNLGGRAQGAGGADAVIQTIGPFRGVWGHPAAYPGEGGWVYTVENGGPLRAFQRSVTATGMPALSPAGTSVENFGYTSGSPAVTSTGTTPDTALVWVVYSTGATGTDAQLRAYRAKPRDGVLDLVWSAPIGTASKFSSVATAGGRVFVGTRDGTLLAFGRPSTSVLTSPSVDFGGVQVGSTSTGYAVFTATRPVTITAATTPEPFAVDAAQLPVTLAAGESVRLPVSFTPAGAGDRSAQLALTTDGGVVATDLHGCGLLDGIGFSPDPVDFGTLVTGGSKTLAVTVANTGSTPQTIRSVSVPESPFAARAVPAAGTVIAPQTSLSIPVTYTPTTAGASNGVLTVTTSDGSYRVDVTGTAIAGRGHLTLTPATVDFGDVVIGTPRTLAFDVSNTGSIPITLTLAKAPAGVFATDVPISEGLILGPGDTIRQQVTFTPTVSGPASDRYQITADDGQGPQQVTLTGNGVRGSTLFPPTGAGWSRNGSTTVAGSDVVLTKNLPSQAGSAFATSTVASNGLTARFQLEISPDEGADGMSFALLPATMPATVVGAPGGGLGFGGLTGAVAVTFDTFQNADDPSANFVGVASGWADGDPTRLAYLASSSNIGPLTSGTHDVVVAYYGGLLRVSVDGALKIEAPVTLPDRVRPGFTAATGGLTDQHVVRNVRITSPKAVPDTVPPRVILTAPAESATVSGTVPLTATATDVGSGVASVQFRIDGVRVATDPTAPYTATWDTSTVPNGQHIVTVIATDSAGNTSTPAQIAVTVQN